MDIYAKLAKKRIYLLLKTLRCNLRPIYSAQHWVVIKLLVLAAKTTCASKQKASEHKPKLEEKTLFGNSFQTNKTAEWALKFLGFCSLD